MTYLVFKITANDHLDLNNVGVYIHIIYIFCLYENTRHIFFMLIMLMLNLCTAEDDQKLNDRNVQILRRVLR